MAHDDHVHFHGKDVIDGIQQGLSFGGGGTGGGKIDGVGGEAFFRQFERDACPGGVLVEEVDDGDVAEGWNFFDGTLQDFFELVAVSKISWISSGWRSLMPRRCFVLSCIRTRN
jgi:hypothetical protein